MFALTSVALLMLALSPAASVRLNRSSAPATLLRSSANTSCFAMCEHSSHGPLAWIGPLRSGPHAATEAANDAVAHNNSNQGHSALSSCNE